MGRWNRDTRVLVALGIAGVALVATLPSRAENKKPGLFDFETWKSPVTQEREAAGQIAPTGMDLSPAVPHTEDPRVIRVRVYADSDYRAMVLRWQTRLRAQFGRINAVAGPVFNVRFELESVRTWEQTHAGVPFDPMMKELAALDEGRQVDLVLGLVTPARGVATAMHQVGAASTPGHHILLRGLDDEEEGRAIDADYHLLSQDERARVYTDRRAHKEVVVFLHEWGHAAGLLHQEDRAMIMNPAYDPGQSRFSDFDKQLLSLVIDKRVGHADQGFPDRPQLFALIEKAPPDFGSDKERTDLLARLRGEPAMRAAPAPPPAAALPKADAQAFSRAVEAIEANQPDQAWRVFAPAFQRLRDGPSTPDGWVQAAQVALAIGALSAAEEAIERVPRGRPDLEKVAADVEALHARVALPPGRKSGLSPEREPAFVAAFWATDTAIASGDLAAARAKLQAFAAAFPDSAGVDLSTCELEVRAKHAAVATQRCEAALSKYKYAERAHLLLGTLAVRSGRSAAAEQHFQAAIHINARDASAWQELARLYRAQGARGHLDELARRYQAAFAAPLP